MSLWTRKEAYDFLDTRFHMDKMSETERERLIDELCAMAHRPWCRANLRSSMPVYGADCTCDAEAA